MTIVVTEDGMHATCAARRDGTEGGPLAEAQVVPWLLERGLLSPAELVDGEVRVLDSSRRNRNFRVLRDAGPAYLVKQGTLRDGFSPVRREARAYELFSRQLMFRATPRVHLYDAPDDVLVVELVPGAEDLRQRHGSQRHPSRRAAGALGDAAARLHTVVPAAVPWHDAQRLLGEGEPGVLTVQRPGLALLRDFSGACIELVRLLQSQADVLELLDEVRRDWRCSALIHHDLRLDNVLVPLRKRGEPPGWTAVLVDWETAALGDPDWDVGTVFGEYLGEWLVTVPGGRGAPPSEMLELASRPLTSVQPAVRAFWQAYVRTARLSREQAQERAVRAARYAGLKLIQSALEQVQSCSVWTVSSVCFLQVGTNVLREPHRALSVLLGLDA